MLVYTRYSSSRWAIEGALWDLLVCEPWTWIHKHAARLIKDKAALYITSAVKVAANLKIEIFAVRLRYVFAFTRITNLICLYLTYISGFEHPCIPNDVTGITLGMGSADDRWLYIVTSSLIGWAHSHKDPCITFLTFHFR